MNPESPPVNRWQALDWLCAVLAKNPDSEDLPVLAIAAVLTRRGITSFTADAVAEASEDPAVRQEAAEMLFAAHLRSAQ